MDQRPFEGRAERRVRQGRRQGLQPGKYSLPINISTPPFVRVRSWQLSTADVEIYRHVERTVAVSYCIEGNLPEGMAVSSVNILPKEAVISGPESDVLSVQSVEAVILRSKIKDGEAIVLPLKVTCQQVNPDRVAITPNQAEVTVSLENEILGESIPVEVYLSSERRQTDTNSTLSWSYHPLWR